MLREVCCDTIGPGVVGDGGGGTGTPGGVDKQVQVNDNGSFGGFSGFTYDDSIEAATVGQALTVGQAGTAGSLTLKNASDTITITLNPAGETFFDSGNVGIGTTTPGNSLEVTNAGTTGGIITAASDFTGAGEFGILSLFKRKGATAATNNDIASIVFEHKDSADGRQEYAAIGGGIEDVTSGSEDGFITFRTTTAGATRQERMRIAAGGNVGIGVTPTTVRLDVDSDGGGQIARFDNSTAGSTSGFISVFNPSDTFAAFGPDGSGFNGGNTSDVAVANLSNGSLTFYTNNSLKMTLSASGALGIGRVSAANILEINGDASKNVAGDWLLNSDERIKTNILDITNAKATISALRPVTFKYTEDYRTSNNRNIADKTYYNYIAQEYQSVFPDSVKGSGEFLDEERTDEILQMESYSAQVVIVKAVQELITDGNDIRTRLDALEAV